MVVIQTMLNYDKTDAMDVTKNRKAYKSVLLAASFINFYQ